MTSKVGSRLLADGSSSFQLPVVHVEPHPLRSRCKGDTPPHLLIKARRPSLQRVHHALFLLPHASGSRWTEAQRARAERKEGFHLPTTERALQSAMAPGAVEAVFIITADNAILSKKTLVSTKVAPANPAQDALDAALARFAARNPRSRELHELAISSMPGGNTRTQLHTSPYPVCMKSGKGYQVTSEDGHTLAEPVVPCRSHRPLLLGLTRCLGILFLWGCCWLLF